MARSSSEGSIHIVRRLLSVGADELGDALQSAIEHAAQTAGVEHSMLALSTHGQIEILATAGASRGLYEARVAESLDDPSNAAEQFSFTASRFIRGEVVCVPAVEDLPDGARAERENFERYGVQSFLAIPIRSATGVIGTQIFESLSRKCDWSDEDIAKLQDIAEMIGAALDRRAADTALQESEERFRALTEHATELIAELDANGVYRYVSPSVRDLLGYEPEELLGTSSGDLLHPDDLKASGARLGAAFETESRSHAIHRLRHRDGSWRWFDNTGRAFRSRKNQIRFVSVGRDITERKRAEDAVKQRVNVEAHLATLSRRFLDVSPEEAGDAIRLALEETCALVGADRGYLISYLPHAGERSETYEWNKRIERSAFEAMPWATPKVLAGEILHIPDISQLPAEASIERQRYAEDGTRSLIGVPLLSGGKLLAYFSLERSSAKAAFSDEQIHALGVIGQIFVSTLRRRRWAERLRESHAQLAQAQKIEAVGRLAGGIAHDFNNLLTVILGFARPLREDLDDYGAQRDVDQVIQAAERAAALTGQLLSFSRQQTVVTQPVDLNTIASGVEVMLGRILEEDVRLSFELSSDPCITNGDPHQFEQVLVNLAVNARDAMPDGGDLVVRTRIETVDDPDCASLGLERAGPYVVLEVSDTGEGMSAETRDHSLEPFYTTKKQGKGTGLGLSIAYGVIRQAKGGIAIDSKPGAGTTIRIHLPLVGSQPKARVEKVSAAPAPANGCILLVEDERAVRELVRRLLEKAGYTVIGATDGVDALSRFKEAVQVDALVTDVVMPRMGGFQLARELRADRPELPVLYVSGYPESDTKCDAEDAPSGAFVVKPFSADRLLSRLAEILEGPVAEATKQS